jgi:superfamily II DNA or RNA helicase/diadenosine tetraphosphate (Ap4A) HIT family hydrolase/HKD family nuclease
LSTDCPFCNPNPSAIFHEGESVYGLWDAFPVSDGHALLVTRRHVASWFEATPAERLELTEATLAARRAIQRRFPVEHFNIGMNVGGAAGQTVRHLHMHVIPRRPGDVPDPRGGVRYVIPAKANYLAPKPSMGAAGHAPELLSTGGDRPLSRYLSADLAHATELDAAVAFVLKSGVDRIYDYLEELLARNGRLRLLAGDYLDITDPDALRQLMDLAVAHPGARVELRVYETAGVSFHPKAYLVGGGPGGGVAYVGSSNLSRSALDDGVEWNYRVLTGRDQAGFAQVAAAFEQLFRHPATKPLDDAWLTAYRARRRPPTAAATVDQVAEPAAPPPEPNAVQLEALDALEQTRQQGFTAGIVVMATGLGKTWLAAFDTDRPEFERVLFVAHRDEILGQALKTFRAARPRATFGFYDGEEKSTDGDVVFGSIQTLGKRSHLTRFAPKHFDYVVVDEFHHASAATYRRLIEHFRPKFLLGLTATPERTDGGDLLALCQENLVYRKDLPAGIRLGLLSPFHYFGVPDEIDYQNLPWRSASFDEEALTTAVATNARAENAFEQWKKHGGGRTLAFCVSRRHADFVRDFFVARGARAASVHSGETTDPRVASMEKLASGELDVVFAVDIFNEGVDVPAIDTVLMLRPTESQILWLQQLGRGLRKVDGKVLKVIDYIGNHRVFLVKVRALLQLPPGNDAAVATALAKVGRGEWDLPPGCDVTYELRTLEILRGLLRQSSPINALKDYYLEYRERLGVRPTAVEAHHDGFEPRSVRVTHGSWLEFVDAMGDLDEAEKRALDRARTQLRAFEATQMTKSYKMLVVSALLDAGALMGRGLRIEELVRRVRDAASRNPRLLEDLGPDAKEDRALRTLLERNPIAAWTGGRGTGGDAIFSYEDGWFRFLAEVAPEDADALARLVRELVDWRIAAYLDRPGAPPTPGAFTMGVSHTKGKPILCLPDRDTHPNVPSGWQRVVVDGTDYQANFAKIAVNVVRRSDEGDNDLPAILRGWFGAQAGLPQYSP